MTITCKLCPTPAWFDFGHGATLCEHCAAKMLQRCRIYSTNPNPIPSQNPPGSEPCGAALDDKAAPLFSFRDGIQFFLQRDSNNEPMARGG